MLRCGIPKEIKPREKRVGMTPDMVAKLCREGIPVFLEKGAGLGSGYADEEYRANGAEIVSTPEELYGKAQLIQKVKEPQPAEYDLLKPSHWLFCFLHLASPEQCELVRRLCGAGLHAIGYETVEKEGDVPLLKPMSEIAGGLAALYGAYLIEQKMQSKSSLIYPDDFQDRLETIAKNFPDCPRDFTLGNVIIYGAGHAGMRAYDLTSQMHGKITLVERNEARRESLKQEGIASVHPKKVSHELLMEADLLIGCAHSPGKRAANVLEEKTLASVSKGRKKVMMDVAIDQGGNFPNPRSTTYEDPAYRDTYGNIRFAVANLPSLCGPKASQEIARETLPYTLALAQDPQRALDTYPELRKGLNIADGKVVRAEVAEAHRFKE